MADETASWQTAIKIVTKIPTTKKTDNLEDQKRTVPRESNLEQISTLVDQQQLWNVQWMRWDALRGHMGDIFSSRPFFKLSSGTDGFFERSGLH